MKLREGPARMAAIVLNYRTAEDTISAVQSLLESSRKLDEIVVVDNASGDGSEERLRAGLPGITILQTGRNVGYSGGNNLGIRDALTRGADFIFIVNSDVVVPPDCIIQLETALTANEGLGLAGPAILSRTAPPRIDSIGISFSARTGRMRHPGHGQAWASMPAPPIQIVDAVTGCAMMIRREVFEAVGLLAEEYFFGFEDLDFCLRARMAGFASACIGSAAVLHEGSVSMGRHSPARVYYAARNQLLLASRVSGSQFFPARWLRAASIVALNLAYVALQPDVPRLQGLSALVGGVRDHLAGRYGEGQFPRTDGPNQDTRRQSPPSGRL